jgi:hypothetical protein
VALDPGSTSTKGRITALTVVREMAADLVVRHGENAPSVALEHEDNARRRGNDEDADAWLEIAAAATEMILGIPIASTALKFRRRPQ